MWQYFYEEGGLKAEEEFNISNSFYTSYYGTGKLKSTGHLSNSKKDSLWSYYFENGQLKGLGGYEDDYINGYLEVFLPEWCYS